MHFMDPPRSNGQLRQLLGRPVRLCSHAALMHYQLQKQVHDPTLLHVHVRMYCSVIGHPAFYTSGMPLASFPDHYIVAVVQGGFFNDAPEIVHRYNGRSLPDWDWVEFPYRDSTPDEFQYASLAVSGAPTRDVEQFFLAKRGGLDGSVWGEPLPR